jgi:succinate dehydrogenase/fumarate reductase flavoprotein subunit
MTMPDSIGRKHPGNQSLSAAARFGHLEGSSTGSFEGTDLSRRKERVSSNDRRAHTIARNQEKTMNDEVRSAKRIGQVVKRRVRELRDAWGRLAGGTVPDMEPAPVPVPVYVRRRRRR